MPPDLDAHVRVTDPPIFRKLGAYTRVEWSPQADALIAALLAATWVDAARRTRSSSPESAVGQI